MKQFLAVVLGALIGLGVVWFGFLQPRKASHNASHPTPTSHEASAPAPNAASTPEPEESAPVANPTTDANRAAALDALTSDDDVVRGSAVEEWGAKVKDPSSSMPIERIALDPALLAAFGERLHSMPPDRLIVYVEAWGGADWWVKHFPADHARYTVWRISVDDPVWLPYAYDQLDRFNTKTDLASIRSIIELLLQSKVGIVRHRALESAAHYFGLESRQYALTHLTDPENSVARLAWLIAAKTGDVDTANFDWHTGPRFVGEAVLYSMAIHDPQLAKSTCDMLEHDPIVANWYTAVLPHIRQRADGATDRGVIVTLNTGEHRARIFEEAIRVDELLSGEHPEYVQE